MDFLSMLNSLQDSTQVFTVQDVLLTTLLSFVLAVYIGWIYKITHRSTTYTQSYVHTLVIMAMVVAIIMLVIGSNIARAFTLVGALSIVRFRNAVKETRDVGFIFFAMAIGMACGTRFYMLAVVSTLTIGILIWAMVRFDLFAKPLSSQLLRIRLPSDLSYASLFEGVFARYLHRYDLVAMETVQAGTLTELVYSVELRQPGEAQAFLNELRTLNDNNKVVLISGEPEVDL